MHAARKHTQHRVGVQKQLQTPVTAIKTAERKWISSRNVLSWRGHTARLKRDEEGSDVHKVVLHGAMQRLVPGFVVCERGERYAFRFGEKRAHLS